jgi:hypothetical protein
MRKVGRQVCVMADQFEAGLAVVQNDDFTADRYKWNERIRPEAAFASPSYSPAWQRFAGGCRISC